MSDQSQKSDFHRAFLRFSQNPLSLIGLSIVLAVALAAIFAPIIVPYPQDVGEALHFESMFEPPSLAHPFGTDGVGRDILTRVVFGARVSLLVGVMVIIIATGVGITTGLIAAYYEGIVETIIMRLVDVFLSVPPIVLALAASAVLAPSMQTSMIAISFGWWPWYTRLVYGEALSLKQEDYVEASRSVGSSSIYIMFREILPNMTSSLAVKMTLDMGYAILTAAALGFLGLGVQPPTPEWGTMVSTGRAYLPESWWLSTFSGLAIFLTVLGFNLLGDGLRDFFDVEVQ